MYLDNLYRKGKADLGVAAKASDSSAATGRGGEGGSDFHLESHW